MDKYIIYTNMELFLDKLLPQTTNLANFSAIIKENIEDLNWVGFYLYNGENLYLGPFQGKAAVTLIEIGKGVCGRAAEKRETIVVSDVHKFPGHIACDCDSLSEIVIPIIKDNKLFGVLDIDSPIRDRFNQETKEILENLVKLLIDFL